MSIEPAGIRIREGDQRDREFVLVLVPQLLAFGPPAWRDARQMDAVDRRVIAEALEGRPSDACVLIAEDAMGHRLGFIHLSEEEDYYAGTCAHVGDIVVTPDARGKGIGRALLERAEAWARERGHRLMSLNVFLRNERARALYEQVGYKPETVRLVKSL